MKLIHTLKFAFIGVSFSFLAQTTNIEGSKYKFTEIVKLPCTAVQSQGKSSTCWSFSALSFFESELYRMGIKDVAPLSEMYIVRKAYELKAEKFIRMDGKINFGEGGAFHDIPLVIRKFGIVPYAVYTGFPGVKYESSDFSEDGGLKSEAKPINHGELYKDINAFMQEMLTQLSNENGIDMGWKRNFNKKLDSYLGEDITEFEWNGNKYTPKSYAASLRLDMDNYVSLTSFTNHPMYQKCMLEIPDNWAWGESYNVGIDDLMETAVSALKNGYTLAWGADVSEKGFSFKNGIAIVPKDESTIAVTGKDSKGFNDAGADRSSNAFFNPGEELKITPELRQLAYDNKTTTDDHGMHIVGLYQDQKGVNYFLVKNSWGTNNLPKGYLYVSENYFKYKTINIYLHKDGIPQNLKNRFK